MKQKGFAPILIVLLVALAVGGYLLYQKQPKPVSISQPSPSPTAFDETVYTEASRSADWKTYTNNVARFSIQYPPLMTYAEKSSEELRQLVLDGEEGTITIIYALVGEKTPWGGGCNKEEHKKIRFLNKEEEVCLGDDYLSQLYTDHPENLAKFAIYAKFSPINQETILKILSTFKFTQ